MAIIVALVVNVAALGTMSGAVSTHGPVQLELPKVVTVDFVTVMEDETTATPSPFPTSTPEPDRDAAKKPQPPQPETTAQSVVHKRQASQVKPSPTPAPPVKDDSDRPQEAPNAAPPVSVVSIAPEWRVDRSRVSIDDVGAEAFADRTGAGAGDGGLHDRMRRTLNDAACEDLQLAVRLGAACPSAGAYMRYADKAWAQRDLSVYRETFGPPGPLRVMGPAPEALVRNGVMPEPVSDTWSSSRSNASTGMVGTLPNPHPHPEYSDMPAR